MCDVTPYFLIQKSPEKSLIFLIVWFHADFATLHELSSDPYLTNVLEDLFKLNLT